MELARVLRPGGFFIFDFDNSGCAEYIFSKAFRKNAVIVNIDNSGYADRYWVYSPRYIRSILKEAGLEVRKIEYFHILSSFIKDDDKAVAFAKYDAIFNSVPLLRECSCNVILTCRKLPSFKSAG